VIVDSPSREFPEPLVVPDPVDPKRNVAAAVSVKRLAEFVLAARAYIDSPSENFFFPQMVKDGIVKGDVFVIELTPTAIVPKEVLWGQINNAMSKIKKFLIQAGFRVVDVNAWGEVIIAVQLESKEIGKYKLQQGPPFYMRNDASAFLQAHDAVWIGEDGRLQAIVERETDPFVISRRALDFSFPYRVQFRWIKSGEDIWLAQFLRKRPSWLR
jgi:tRNA nucleotidyltransferase (CCA-adding enzyme)